MRVKTNTYRVVESKGCSDCPFRDNGKAMQLRDGRVDEIKAMLLESDQNSFNCHKTVYILKAHGKPNLQMRLAYSLGVEEM